MSSAKTVLPSAPNLLSQTQIDDFISDGYITVQNVFSANTAEAIREALWDELTAIGVTRHDPATWTKPVVHLTKTFTGEPFASAWTERLYAALDDVMGVGRYLAPVGLGWWPVSFPNLDPKPWVPPTIGWHIDGIQFHHHIHSPDQGLLPLFLLSDIQPYGGGTAVSVGSHRTTARILAEAEPDGLSAQELTERVLAHPIANVRELTGKAGDVVLVHPFLLHARSPNTGNSVRFICNPCIPLRQPMNLARAYTHEYSLVELAIVLALADDAEMRISTGSR
ncbi:MAG: phytanoyl-CoA dioxygenase family protein [Capsulimonas sp.]|uniref:phytanoyl-CoA dioxygenase family protein n=1 Tax=Capsulimonas sp. TaxID=2494211 RepID=UPI003262FECD